MLTQNGFTDLRDEVEYHCMHCEKLETDYCKVCFFSTVDLARIDLGNKRVYRRAYRYLRHIRKAGFKRDEVFGTHLNLIFKRKVVMA